MNLKALLVIFLTILASIYVIFLSLLCVPVVFLEKSIKGLFLCIYKVVGIKFKVHGKDNIDPNASYIYISNHSSLLDIPSIKASLPFNVKFIAKKELFKIPLFGIAIKRLGTIPIDRANKKKAIESLLTAKQRLHEGMSIWMAPEGTRNIDGNIGKFKKGAFMTASQAGVKLVPVSLCGTWKVLPKKSFKVQAGRIDVYINKPINVDKENIQVTIEEAHRIISQDIQKWKHENEKEDCCRN